MREGILAIKNLIYVGGSMEYIAVTTPRLPTFSGNMITPTPHPRLQFFSVLCYKHLDACVYVHHMYYYYA